MSVLLDKSILLTPELGNVTVEKVGLFPRGHVTLIAGEPGIGKTWFMLSISQSVAGGHPGLGDPIMKYPQGRVMIFAGETGVRLLANRVNLMGGIFPIENVRVVSSHRMAMLNIDTMCNTAIGRKNILDAITEFRPDVVFFDTMISFMSDGKDESSQVDMSDCIRGLGAIAAQTGCAMVLLHHFRKRQSGSDSSRSMDDVIGSSAFTRLASVVIGIERKREVRYVKCLKSWWEEFAPFSFIITRDDKHVYLKGDYNYEADGTYSVSRTSRKVEAHIKAHYDNIAFTVMDVVSDLDISRSAVQDAVSALVSKGEAYCEGKVAHTKVYRLGQPDDQLDEEEHEQKRG